MNFYMIYWRDLDRIAKQKNVEIIDLRERTEYEQDHWENAINMPEATSEYLLKNLVRGKKYVLYCDYGGSSMKLAQHLGRKGYQVFTVIGGYNRFLQNNEKKYP